MSSHRFELLDSSDSSSSSAPDTNHVQRTRYSSSIRSIGIFDMLGKRSVATTTGWWTRERWTAIFFVVGCALAITGHYTYNRVDSFIARQIEKQVPIRNNTDAFKKWQKLAVPMTIRFYLFNVTNADHVIRFGEKPRVEQVGPYVFEETRFKIDVRFDHHDEHILYREAKKYWFDPQRSGDRTLDDVVIVPSIPEMALIAKLSQQADKLPAMSAFLYNMLNAALQTSGARLFAPQRVGDLLFDGYKVRTLETVLNITRNIPNNPLNIKSPLLNNKFGFFYLKNGTEDPELGEWRVHTGLNDAARFGQVLSYNDKQENACWRQSVYCNAMIGTDGSQFPPNLDAGVDHVSAHPATEFAQQLFLRSLGKDASGSNPKQSSATSSTGNMLTKLAEHLLRVEHSSADPSGKRRLFVYNPDVFRWVYLQFEHKTQVRGIPAYRYTLPESFYTAPSDAPENACFCTQADEPNISNANRNFLASIAAQGAQTPAQLQAAYRKTFPAQCRLHGIMDISYCRKAPIVVSAPHFWSGDPLLVHSVDGLHPNDALHKTYVDVEPVSKSILKENIKKVTKKIMIF